MSARKKHLSQVGLIIVLLLPSLANADSDPPRLQAELVEVRKIWDHAPHNAFTDLVRWNDKFYCAFREGQGHAGDLGKLRIIVSANGAAWESAGLLSLEAYDLRDAAISITPDNRLMVLGGAQQVRDGRHDTGTFVSFSTDGIQWTPPRIVVPLGRWLWRVTWHDDVAYGVSYATPEGKPYSALHLTRDGINYETVVPELLGEGGWPTEARLRFDDDGTAYCLHRRDGPDGNSAFLGVASPPYTEWQWHDLGIRFGGPNFVRLPNGAWVGAGRLYDGGARTELTHLDVKQGTMKPILRLPSGGDTSYPGMVWHDGMLWVSYYSSHEGRTSIYLAKVRFPDAAPTNLSNVNAVPIGSRRELFVDRMLVDSLSGDARFRLHPPQPQEIVLETEKPWEGIYSAYFTVIQDTDKFRMYYRGMPKAKHDLDTEVTCYAESVDGIHWMKPSLGLYNVHGSTDNNVILARHRACHNFAPFKDTNPDCPPAQRYKAVGGTGAPGLIAFTSPDAIHWEEIQPEPVITQGAFDSQNVSFWSESERRYVCYFRVFRRGVRWIARTTSDDFVHWTEPVDLDFGDNPAQHLYTNQLAPYARAPHIYIGTPTRFMPGRKALSHEQTARLGTSTAFDFRNDCADIMLVSTRGGGSQFDRSFMEAFIRPGLDPKNWTSCASYAAYGIVETRPDELSIFVNHNVGYPSSHIRRYTIRPDGFASVGAGFDGGQLVTQPITFSGDRLSINYATSAAGGLRIEIQDAAGDPIPGYALDDCPEIIGDEISRTVSWNNGDDIGPLAGKALRLRVELTDADLYSFQFVGQQ